MNSLEEMEAFSFLNNSMSLCLGDLKDVLNWLRENRENREICNSAATHYLYFWFGFWSMDDIPFCEFDGFKIKYRIRAAQVDQQKVKTAEFYAAQILPNTKSLKHKIIDGSKVVEKIR